MTNRWLPKIRFTWMINPVVWTFIRGSDTPKKYIVDYWEMRDAQPNMPASYIDITHANRYRVINLRGLCLVLIWD